MPPPVGPGFYTVMTQTGIRMAELLCVSIPILTAMVACIVKVKAVPALSAWFPTVFGFG